MRKILVTTGLPYANGQIHLGHLVENIQADIWVRWQKLQGNDCIFICGDDAHGTPIMLSARQRGISAEELIDDVKQQHEADFADFYVDFDSYHTTHSPENKALVEDIYNKLKQNNDIIVKTIVQAYDPEAKIFLPDRFVRGTCPKCGALNQYGDNCEICGATYSPTDLKDAFSVISGKPPIQKTTEHYFFDLQKHESLLKEWLQTGAVQQAIANKLQEWFESGLKPWDISRDEPYFGFPIPGVEGKYFYVWMDAPVGYMASFKKLCEKRHDLNFAEYWQDKYKAELCHFVGKDIVYFHALFWPAILYSSGYRLPTNIFTHGYLTVNGNKMSKSRGTFILARDYLEQNFDAEWLRYYYAAKLNDSIDDIDLNLTDFAQRVNSDLVGKVVNIASRCAGFIKNNFDNKLAVEVEQPHLFAEFRRAADSIAQGYEKLRYSDLVRVIMALADQANRYIDDRKPWHLAKDPQNAQQVQVVCTTGLNLFRLLMLYLKPILPKMAQKTEVFLNINPLCWHDHTSLLLNHSINNFQPLMQRIDFKKLELLVSNGQE